MKVHPRPPLPIALRVVAVLLPVLGLLVMVGCGPDDPMEEIAAKRAKYSVKLNSVAVESQPLPPAATEDAGLAEGEEDGLEEVPVPAPYDGDPVAVPMPVNQTVLLDLLVQSKNREQLPGITLDVIHFDSSQQEKGKFRIWLDTSAMNKGSWESIIHRLEDVEYATDDGFHVEVRDPVPASERGEYKEFSLAGSEAG